jgi:hypothetical protein
MAGAGHDRLPCRIQWKQKPYTPELSIILLICGTFHDVIQAMLLSNNEKTWPDPMSTKDPKHINVSGAWTGRRLFRGSSHGDGSSHTPDGDGNQSPDMQKGTLLADGGFTNRNWRLSYDSC